MKFKVGDKVRILPSAVDIGVFEDEVGKVGIITDNNLCDKYVHLLMDKPRWGNGQVYSWGVKPSQIELVVVPGQQLLLWDDIWEE